VTVTFPRFPSAANKSVRIKCAALVALGFLARPLGEASVHGPGPYVQPCIGIRLSASYLAEVSRGSGPGFHFTLRNNTDKTVRLAKPVASSAHWYARENGRWMWRASNGEGGALVNAENPRGAIFAFQPVGTPGVRDVVTIAPHAELTWDESARENPVLVYRPSCKVCNYPLDRQYRVVFGYGYLPPRGASPNGLLTCGIRSNEVDMPPLGPVAANQR
jgi:hypothetical protein